MTLGEEPQGKRDEKESPAALARSLRAPHVRAALASRAAAFSRAARRGWD